MRTASTIRRRGDAIGAEPRLAFRCSDPRRLDSAGRPVWIEVVNADGTSGIATNQVLRLPGRPPGERSVCALPRPRPASTRGGAASVAGLSGLGSHGALTLPDHEVPIP